MTKLQAFENEVRLVMQNAHKEGRGRLHIQRLAILLRDALCQNGAKKKCSFYRSL